MIVRKQMSHLQRDGKVLPDVQERCHKKYSIYKSRCETPTNIKSQEKIESHLIYFTQSYFTLQEIILATQNYD